MTEAQPASAATPTLQLTRWTVTSSSNAQSRGAVVIEAASHHWRASAEGNGAVDALFKAVDGALAEVLQGHPKLVGYDVTYRLEDKEGTLRTSFKPGSTLPVKDGQVIATPPDAG